MSNHHDDGDDDDDVDDDDDDDDDNDDDNDNHDDDDDDNDDDNDVNLHFTSSSKGELRPSPTLNREFVTKREKFKYQKHFQVLKKSTKLNSKII